MHPHPPDPVDLEIDSSTLGLPPALDRSHLRIRELIYKRAVVELQSELAKHFSGVRLAPNGKALRYPSALAYVVGFHTAVDLLWPECLYKAVLHFQRTGQIPTVNEAVRGVGNSSRPTRRPSAPPRAAVTDGSREEILAATIQEQYRRARSGTQRRITGKTDAPAEEGDVSVGGKR